MIYAGLMDLVTLKIRNHLVLAVGGGWLILAPLAGFSLAGARLERGGRGGVFVVTFTFFALGWIGGGDAKLAAVTALWFQPDEALLYFIYAALLGGLLTLGILQLRTGLLPLALYRVPWIAQLHDREGRRALRRRDGAGGADRVSRHGLGRARGLLSRRSDSRSARTSSAQPQRSRDQSAGIPRKYLLINHPLTFPRETESH